MTFLLKKKKFLSLTLEIWKKTIFLYLCFFRFIDERSEGFRKNLREFQETKPELIEFYQDSEPKTYKLYLKKSKNYEKKIDQNIKKDTLYNRTLFHLEHDSLTR